VWVLHVGDGGSQGKCEWVKIVHMSCGGWVEGGYMGGWEGCGGSHGLWEWMHEAVEGIQGVVWASGGYLMGLYKMVQVLRW